MRDVEADTEVQTLRKLLDHERLINEENRVYMGLLDAERCRLTAEQREFEHVRCLMEAGGQKQLAEKELHRDRMAKLEDRESIAAIAEEELRVVNAANADLTAENSSLTEAVAAMSAELALLKEARKFAYI